MDAVCEGIEKNKIKLVVIAEDTSDKSKKNIRYVCTNHGIDVIELSTMEELSHAVGKNHKAILGVTDLNFAKRYHTKKGKWG